jgi:hypothetical protein
MDQAETSLAIGDRIQTIDSVEFPSRFGSAKVSAVIFRQRAERSLGQKVHTRIQFVRLST